MPAHAKEEDLARFAHIEGMERRIYAAMMYSMDQGIGKVFKKTSRSK